MTFRDAGRRRSRYLPNAPDRYNSSSKDPRVIFAETVKDEGSFYVLKLDAPEKLAVIGAINKKLLCGRALVLMKGVTTINVNRLLFTLCMWETQDKLTQVNKRKD